MRSRPLVVAHRGFSSLAPENTLSAYREAIRLGADLAECDVHLTRDGVLVLMHDATLDRTTNGSGAVSAHSLAELRHLDAGAWKDERWAGERIPTLVEALRLVRGKIRFVIEIKGPGLAQAVVDAIREAAIAPDDLVIFSFNREAVARVATLEPLLPTAWLLHQIPTAPEARRALLRDALQARASAIGVSHRRLDAALVRMAHERGFLVFSWTIDQRPEMVRLIHMGVDALISNRPDRLLELLAP